MNERYEMSDSEIEAKFKNLSRTAFVDFFDFFQDCHVKGMTTGACVIKFLEKKRERKGNANTRCSAALSIFESKSERRALEIIASKDLSPNTKKRVRMGAEKLLETLAAKGKASRNTITPRKKGQAGL